MPWRMKRLVLVLLVGCATVKVGTQISPGQIGTKYARLTGYMATRGAAPGGRHTETAPAAIRHDAILDEATLASLTPNQTCLDVVIRTAIEHDEPLEQYGITFQLNGAPFDFLLVALHHVERARTDDANAQKTNLNRFHKL